MVIASAFTGELPGHGDRRRRARRRARSRRTRARSSHDDRRPRHRFRRAGGCHPFDHAGVARTAGSSRGRSRCGCSWRGRRTAGRSCPAASVRVADDARRARGEPAAGRAHRPTPGCCRTSRWPRRRCCRRRTGSRSARDRRAAEPRRRQSVLGRPLRRACGGDAAAGSGARHPRRRQRRGGDPGGRATSCELLGEWEAVPTDLPNAKPVLVAAAALQHRDLDGAMPFLVGAAQSAASVIRDRFSPDAWRALTDLVRVNRRAHSICQPTESAIFERVNGALRIIASFSGLAQENMSQLAGWRFLELGRRIERAIATCRFVRSVRVHQARRRRSTSCWSSPTARSPTGCATSWWRRRRR